MKLVALAGSPRRDGNSRALAEAALAGAREAGHETELVQLTDRIEAMLRDCGDCRLADGRCSIDDGYRALLLDTVLPADGILYATPLWWYGVSSYLKTFFDRLFCHLADGSPDAETVRRLLPDKRAGLVVSAEESYPGATLPVVQQIQEICLYLRHPFVGVVVGIGNTRGEVARDPADPLRAAHRLGTTFFEARVTGYYFDTPRPNAVWSEPLDA